MKNLVCKTIALSLYILLGLVGTLTAAKKHDRLALPKDAASFPGTFTGINDGQLVMKYVGEKYLINFTPETRFVGRFRGGKIDKEKGEIRYGVYLSPPNHPDYMVEETKHGEKFYLIKKLRDGWQEVNTEIKSRTTDINGFKAEDLSPYGDNLVVWGFEKEDKVIDAILVEFDPILDVAKVFDKNLPNLLNIGDSISIGYRKRLLELCKGNLNYDHPRTNCGGVTINNKWFGAYDEPGRHWDVIAFNGGHWNSSASKEEYVTLFEESLQKCLKAGKKVMWITTANVPYGYNTDLKPSSRKEKALMPKEQWRSIQFACPSKVGRRPGRMMLQNHWVKPILDKYPQVAVCDQWSYVYNASKDENSPFYKWMHGRNVHFGGELNEPLAALIFELTMVMTGKKTMEEVPEQYRDYIHISPKSYNPISEFENPTPEAERYVRPALPAQEESGAEKWWTKDEYSLDATVVNYDKVEGETEHERAQNRVALAEKDLTQHEAWFKTSEVPEAQVDKAKGILEYAKKVAASYNDDQKKKGKKGKKGKNKDKV